MGFLYLEPIIMVKRQNYGDKCVSNTHCLTFCIFIIYFDKTPEVCSLYDHTNVTINSKSYLLVKW